MAGSTEPATWATPLNRVWTEKLAVALHQSGRACRTDGETVAHAAAGLGVRSERGAVEGLSIRDQATGAGQHMEAAQVAMRATKVAAPAPGAAAARAASKRKQGRCDAQA